MTESRLFTLEEAQIALDLIRPLVQEILEIRQDILERQPEVWPVLEKAAGNGGSKSATTLEQRFERLDQIARLIQSLGAILKDINTGLVDFPSIREGREIYLCWKHGEDRIRYWHEIEAGFAGRRPL